MQLRRPTGPEPAHCCHIGCDDGATWRLTTGPEIEDSTDACDDHVADLLAGAPLRNIESLAPAGVAYVDVMLDGPPSHEAGRFIDCVAFHDNGVPHQGPETARGVNAGEWVQVEDRWHLRIPVPSGWLVG